MRMKTFKAATSTAAFAKVKADLGEDAVILSNKTIKENGSKYCEIVAAVGKRSDYSRQTDQGCCGGRRTPRHGRLAAGMEPDQGPDNGAHEAADEPGASFPKQKIAMDYLEREDVDDAVLAKIYCGLRENGSGSVMDVLDPLIKATPFNPSNWTNKFHAMAGPGGAGKTSSLVRLALKIKKDNPKTRICLPATADGGRGKGRLILKHYAELSGLAFAEIITRDDLALLRGEAGQFDMILIDLPASPKRPHWKNG